MALGRGQRWSAVSVATVLVATALPLRAEPPAKPAVPPVLVTPQDPEEAVRAVTTPFPTVNSLLLRPEFTDIRKGGTSTAVLLRTDLRMKYVLIPGIQIPHMTTVLRFDLRFQSLNTPAVSATGLNDIAFFDVPIYRFGWGGLALGFGAVFPAATSLVLGQGKLQLGPVAGVAVGAVPHLVLAVLLFNGISVAGYDKRPEVNQLLVQPIIAYVLPKAFYLRMDPVMLFDWERGGHATVPVNLAVAHAFTAHLVAYVQPEWVITGDGRNNVGVRLALNYLGW